MAFCKIENRFCEMCARTASTLFHIKRRIHIIDILLIQLLAEQFHCLAKSLEVYDFPFAQEFDDIVHIRVIAEPQNVVIGDPCFLFCQGVP